MLDLIVLHGEFSLFTVRGNFWYQIYRNRRKKVLCSCLTGDTRKIFVSNIKTVDESHSARVLIGCKPIMLVLVPYYTDYTGRRTAYDYSVIS